MRDLHLPIRVILYQEEGRQVAHCLEFDLMGDGDTTAEAIEDLAEAIRIQIAETVASGNWRSLFTPADGKFFQMYAAI